MAFLDGQYAAKILRERSAWPSIGKFALCFFLYCALGDIISATCRVIFFCSRKFIESFFLKGNEFALILGSQPEVFLGPAKKSLHEAFPKNLTLTFDIKKRS